MTRSDAIAHARYMFSAVAIRAYENAGDDTEYVWLLARSWQDRLDQLGEGAGLLTDRERRTLDRLTAAVGHPDLSREALIEWVDALPAAIVALFEEAATERLEIDPVFDADGSVEFEPAPEAEPLAAGNRQSTLALAA